jgi:mannose-1-phosphate guanylyltransferase
VLHLKALILAGGFATRLRPLSCTRPKTLFPIVNKPLLEWNYERLSQNGITEAILAVNSLTQFYIKQHHLKKHGLKIRFSVDPPKKPLGTAGPVKKAEKHLKQDEAFIVLNGDIFANFNYKELLDSHSKTGALATIALCSVKDPSSYGVAELAENNMIKRFIEKPLKDNAPSNFINAGVYVLNPKVLDYIPKGKAVSMEREVFPKLAAEGKLFGVLTNCLWIDIGKPQEYLQTNRMMLESYSNSCPENSTFEVKCPVAIAKGVSIGAKSVIGPYAVIGEKTVIGKGVHISNSVIFSGAKINDNATITGAIIGEKAKIGANVEVTQGCLIADHAKIKERLHLKSNFAVCPGKEVTETF